MQKKVYEILYNNKEYVWALIGKFLPQVIYLLTIMALARLLTPEDFGMVGTLSIFVYLASVLMDSGLGGSLVKEKQTLAIDCSTIFTFNLLVSIFLYLLMFLSSPYIEKFFAIDGLCGVARSLSLIFVINAFGIVPNSILTKKLQFKEISYALIISTFIASFCSILLAYFYRSVYAIIVYQLVQASILVIAYHYYCRTALSLSFSILSMKKLLPFGISTTLSSTLDTIYENLISVILGKYAGASVVGYFSQAKRIEQVPSKSVVQTISNTSFPILVKYIDNSKMMDKESMRVFRLSSLTLIPVFGLFICFPDIILATLFGDQWIEASTFLQLLSFAGIFLLVDTMYRGFIKSANQPAKLVKSSVVKRTLGIILILAGALISPKVIMYSYILSSAIAAIISIKYFASIINESFFYYIFRVGQILFLSSVPIMLTLLCELFIDNFAIKIMFALFVLLIYYPIVFLRVQK